MSRLPVLLVAFALAGCGGAAKREPALPPVRLVVDAPLDPATVDKDTVEVHGRVTPASARVLVAGSEAGVEGGSFSAMVSLDPGTNIIDIEAGAPRRAAAMTAVRVVRRVPVEIPDLSGRKPSEALDRLRALGLKPTTQNAGGLLDDILPGTPGVCGTDPSAGSKVKAGSEVTVRVAKRC